MPSTYKTNTSTEELLRMLAEANREKKASNERLRELEDRISSILPKKKEISDTAVTLDDLSIQGKPVTVQKIIKLRTELEGCAGVHASEKVETIPSKATTIAGISLSIAIVIHLITTYLLS